MTHLEHDLDPDAGRAAASGGQPRLPMMMTRPRAYALRMVVFLVMVATVAVVLHEHAERFFMRNPPLNTLILTVLVLGIALSFRAVLSLEPEIAWIERCVGRDRRRSLDDRPPLLGPLAALLEEPQRHLGLTATGVRNMLDGINSRLDERRDTLRYLIGLLIFLGLLGTFWGLLMTANSVGETIRGLNVAGSDPAEMFETLRAGLEAPLAGMGTAFSTSLFGLASSLVLGFLDLQASQAQNRFANELETWLSGFARLEDDVVEGSARPAPSYVTALLQQTAESLDKLERRMVRAADESGSLQETLRGVCDRLARLADELHARRQPADPGADAQYETRAVLMRMASALDRQAGEIDESMRAHVRTLELGVTRLIEDGARGRDRAVDEIRNEIRLLARTLSAIADRER